MQRLTSITIVLLLMIINQVAKAQQLTSGWDSVCYALGITWYDDLARHNIKITPAAFVRGVSACYQHDTSTFSLKRAYDFIEQNEKHLTHDSIASTLRDSLSFALGFAWAKNIYAAGFPCPDAILLLEGMHPKKIQPLTVDRARKVLTRYLEKLREEEYRGIKLMNERWLAENKRNAGVVTLSNGVQYKILRTSGNEKKVKENSILVLSYKAKLIDGTIFEQSKKPEKFYLSALIPGLHEVLLSMHVGEKREVYIPYYLAFGTGGIKNTVPPFATVIYEIELVDVE